MISRPAPISSSYRVGSGVVARAILLIAYLGCQRESRATLQSLETFHYSRNPRSWIAKLSE